MIDKKALCEFLVRAKKATYASGDEKKEVKEDDGSKSLYFKDGEWSYHDNYFGGEPFGGREVVFFQNKPVYMMVYYGRIFDKDSDKEKVYSILKKALSLIPGKTPYRGPENFKEGEFGYVNSFIGEVDGFSGEEKILRLEKDIYMAKYAGGLICL
jgi:hypothetical protein